MPPRRSLRTRTPSKHFDEVEITTPVTAPNSTSKPRSSGSKPQTVITPPHNESNGRITTRSKSKAQNDVDVHHEYEFYGPWGTSAMMLFFPCLLYYLYVCLYFFDGQLVGPGSMEKFRPWLRDIGNLIYKVREKISSCLTYREPNGIPLTERFSNLASQFPLPWLCVISIFTSGNSARLYARRFTHIFTK